jgi:hypothetical protein
MTFVHKGGDPANRCFLLDGDDALGHHVCYLPAMTFDEGSRSLREVLLSTFGAATTHLGTDFFPAKQITFRDHAHQHIAFVHYREPRDSFLQHDARSTLLSGLAVTTVVFIKSFTRIARSVGIYI